MEDMTYDAKIAVIKILTEILNADKIVHEKEVEYLNEVIQSFCLSDSYKQEAESLMTTQALSIISELSISQKEFVAKMMGNMIICDSDINYNEVKLYNAYCKSCNINRDLHVEEYGEISLSGPFINPEDLMTNE